MEDSAAFSLFFIRESIETGNGNGAEVARFDAFSLFFIRESIETPAARTIASMMAPFSLFFIRESIETAPDWDSGIKKCGFQSLLHQRVN